MKLLTLLALALAGCILPVATGAPQPATTVGRGHVGISFSGEAPVLDLIANNKSAPNDNDYTSTYGESPAAALTATLAIGLGDDTDLEIAGQGALYYFFFPIPTGATIGLRQHLLGTDTLDLAIAAQVGGVTSGGTSTDSNGNSRDDEASAYYGAVQAVLQLREGRFRPLASINLMPFHITRAPEGEPIQRFAGFASSATVALLYVTHSAQLGPYITVTDFASENFSGGQFVSGGLMLAIRPDRHPPPPPPPQVIYPVTPYPQPLPPPPMPAPM